MNTPEPNAKLAFQGYNVFMFKKVDGLWVDL